TAHSAAPPAAKPNSSLDASQNTPRKPNQQTPEFSQQHQHQQRHATLYRQKHTKQNVARAFQPEPPSLKKSTSLHIHYPATTQKMQLGLSGPRSALKNTPFSRFDCAVSRHNWTFLPSAVPATSHQP
ncbi:MAG: hypothetical protein ACKPJJ_38095, partial [Planctomycetaceae bacterium]